MSGEHVHGRRRHSFRMSGMSHWQGIESGVHLLQLWSNIICRQWRRGGVHIVPARDHELRLYVQDKVLGSIFGLHERAVPCGSDARGIQKCW